MYGQGSAAVALTAQGLCIVCIGSMVFLIPRDTIEQAQAGVQRSYEQAQPGDLLLFAYEEEKEKSITSVFI